MLELVLETAAAGGVAGVSDAPPPRTLQNLRVVVRHDHLGPEMRIYDAGVNLHGVVDDALNVQYGVRRPRNVHGSPYHILNQNSAMFQNSTDLWDRRVPVSNVHETQVYDAKNCLVILTSQVI